MRPLILLLWEPTDPEWQRIEATWPAEAEPVTRAELERRPGSAWSEVRVAVGSMRAVDPPLLRQLPRLEFIHTLGHGVDMLLAGKTGRTLRARAIQVAKANAAGPAIAEFVIMSMILLSRRVLALHEALVQHGDWSRQLKERRGAGALGSEIRGSTLGLLGYGNIGREVAARARGMSMAVHAVVRHPERIAHEQLEEAWPVNRLDDMLERCDYVALNLPLTDATRHIMDKRRFGAMSPGAYLTNIGRGRLIDERALFEALRSKRLAGAALDVWYEERPRFAGYPSRYPLHQFNVLMTPHYAGSTMESRARALAKVGENLRLWLSHEPLRDTVDVGSGF